MSRVSERVSVREATVPELPDVLNVLDGAALAVDTGRLRSAIDRGEVLVAVAGGNSDRERPPDSEQSTEGRIVGALVLEGREITAVAVRRRRRDQGIGTALVEAATRRRDRLLAEFDAGVRPFWESLGFAVEPAAEQGRFRGRR